MVDGRGADGEKEERRKREVCSPEGFKAGAGLRGSYTAPPFAVTNSTWPPLWTPFSVPPSSSSSFSFFFFLFVHLFRPSSPNRNYSLLVPLPPTLDKYVRVLRPPFPLPRLLRSSSIHHLPSETSLAPFPRTLSLSDHPRSLRLGLSLARVRATYRHKPMLGQYFSVAAVISWTPGPR